MKNNNNEKFIGMGWSPGHVTTLWENDGGMEQTFTPTTGCPKAGFVVHKSALEDSNICDGPLAYVGKNTTKTDFNKQRAMEGIWEKHLPWNYSMLNQTQYRKRAFAEALQALAAIPQAKGK